MHCRRYALVDETPIKYLCQNPKFPYQTERRAARNAEFLQAETKTEDDKNTQLKQKKLASVADRPLIANVEAIK